MQTLVVILKIFIRRIDTLIFRLWFFQSHPKVLRHLLYLHRHGRHLTARNLPDYYLKNWLISDRSFKDYTFDIFYGCGNDIPYAVATYAFSRFTNINRNNSLFSPYKIFGYTLNFKYPEEYNFLILGDLQTMLETIQAARRNEILLPDMWLFRCFDDPEILSDYLYRES